MTRLAEATTEELLDEIRRRSIGCMLVVMRAESDGDVWHYQLKGSQLLMGAMSAALNMAIERELAQRPPDHLPF